MTVDFVAIDKQQLLQELARKAGLIVEVLPDRILTELTKRDAVDGKPVDIVFQLLLPDTQDGQQLGALACIACKLRQPVVTAALRSARDGSEIYRPLVVN